MILEGSKLKLSDTLSFFLFILFSLIQLKTIFLFKCVLFYKATRCFLFDYSLSKRAHI